MINKLIYIIVFALCFSIKLSAQSFAPAAGLPGSTAIFKDSNAILSWATGIEIQRGYLDIANKNLGFASNGNDADGLVAEGDITTVVSLGDSGVAILAFAQAISDGPGFDFAIFENGFDDDYLELAHVEVSSDGVNYFRFQSISEVQTDTQISPYAYTDCRRINNLAGKYRAGWGTPFDLSELSTNSLLDLQHITHVKIIDVVGSIDPSYGSFDSQGTIINDGYPSNFAAGGFDLDGVAVLKHPTNNINEIQLVLNSYPNPTGNYLKFTSLINKVEIFDLSGKLILQAVNVSEIFFNLPEGIYQVALFKDEFVVKEKLIVLY